MATKPTRVTLVDSDGIDLLSGGSGVPTSDVPLQGLSDCYATEEDDDAVVTLVAPAPGYANVIGGLVWSYSDDPTGGRLTIESDGDLLYDVDVTTGGPGFFIFDPPLMGNAVEDLVVTLTAGGTGVVGKLTVLGVTTGAA